MLKKAIYPSSNNSPCILTILNGAKKRRSVAYAAVKGVNSGFGIKPDLASVK